MNRSRIAQLTVALATVILGSTTYVVLQPKQSTDHADLTDAGATAANRVATCPVRISKECRALYGVRAYETLRFPVVRDVLPDGGIAILMPAASKATDERLRGCVHVMDWSACDLDPVASFPAVAARWGNANPFVLARAASKFVIPDCRNSDGGWNDAHAPVACLVRSDTLYGDGGFRWAGCNVILRSQSQGAACLDAPTGTVDGNERIEDSL